METILRLPVVKAKTGLSRSTLYLLMARGEFPQSVRLGRHAVGWVETDVARWIEERIAQSRPAQRVRAEASLEA